MTTKSRFDKLEVEGAHAEAPATGASMERFAAEPELGTRAPRVDQAQPTQDEQRLQRFDADGADGLGLDRDPLAALPMLECPACKSACGKFELQCHACQASLTTDAARAHNLQRLTELTASRAQELDADRERLRVHLDEAELQRMQRSAAERGMARELGEKFSGARWWVSIACFYGLALLGPGFGFKLLMFLLGTVVLLAQLSPRVWLKLGENVKTWRRW